MKTTPFKNVLAIIQLLALLHFFVPVVLLAGQSNPVMPSGEISQWPLWTTNLVSPNFESTPLSNVVAFLNQALRTIYTNQSPPSIRLDCTPTRFTKRNVGPALVPAADKLIEEYRQHHPTQEWSLVTLENRCVRCDFSYITLSDCIRILTHVESLRSKRYSTEIVITPPWPEVLECCAFVVDERFSSRIHLIGSGPIMRPEYSQDLAPSFDSSGGMFPPDGPMRLLTGTNVILSLNRPSWNEMVSTIIQSWEISVVEEQTVIKKSRPNIRELTDGYDWGLDRSRLSKFELKNSRDWPSRDADLWYWQFLGEFAKVAINHQ